jgi:hypothetical protein
MGTITPVRRAATLAAGLMLAFALAACSGGATPSSPAPLSPAPSSVPPPAPSATPAPSASSDPGASTGEVPPGQPVIGEPRTVTLKPGQLDVHPVAADQLAATVNGRDVVVEIGYATGVEPCYVLDSIVVQRGDHSFAITLRQGHEPGDAVCIQIAEMVRSFVDLGDLDPGTYTITDAQNGAAPISVVVP